MNGDAAKESARGPVETVIAAPSHALPLLALASIGAALAHAWRRYRGEASLMNARDAMLNDVGLTRAEVEQRIGGRPYF
jgi:hypothetical protein